MDSKNKKTEEIKTQLRDLIKQTLQEALEGELEEYLGYPKNKPPKDKSTKPSNVRNGYSTKTVKSDSGEMELEVPRDRNSEFEPQIVKKRQSVLDDLEDKIVALYSKGMTTRDIQDILEDMYGVELSPSLISRLTDRMLPRLEEWQMRPLGEAYTVIWLDCIFYKVREEGKVLSKAIYLVIGLGLDGMKEILGFWVSAKESSGFWLGVLNDLKSRGVRDVFIFSVDGLNGLEEAIAATYPASDIQRCVIHQIRNTLRYVSWKDKKELSKDLKTV
jgi:transposase-like protein